MLSNFTLCAFMFFIGVVPLCSAQMKGLSIHLVTLPTAPLPPAMPAPAIKDVHAVLMNPEMQQPERTPAKVTNVNLPTLSEFNLMTVASSQTVTNK